MTIDGVVPPALKLQTVLRASAGKFRVVLLIDSETYQLGEDQRTIGLAIDLYVQFGRDHPFQIYNDKGKGQIRQFD